MLRLRPPVQYVCAGFALWAMFASAVSARPVEVTTVSGQTVAGELVSWTTDRIELSTSDGPHAFTPAELLAVSVGETPASGKGFKPFIELADESRVPVTEFTVIDRVAKVVAPLADEPLTVPAEDIRLVQWVDAAVSLPRPEATGDCVAVLKKDSTETEILTGIIGNVTAEQVEFTWEGETLPVKRSKIAALSFFRKDNRESSIDPLCYVEFTSGARLAASQVQLVGDDLEVTTVAGVKLQVPRVDLIAADYSVGKLSYLSDLKPLRSKWTPLVEMPAAAESIKNFGAPRMNISFTGSPLALAWPATDGATSSLETYNKGLALRSRTELEYRLPRGMRRFVAVAGIDPETLTQGDILLQIVADGDVIFEQAISGTNPPVEIDANIAGKQKLRIVVDYGHNLDLGDRLHLVEARFIK